MKKSLSKYQNDTYDSAKSINDNRSNDYYASLFNLINALELGKEDFHKHFRNKLVHGYFNIDQKNLQLFCRNIGSLFNDSDTTKKHPLFLNLIGFSNDQEAVSMRLQQLTQTQQLIPNKDHLKELKKSYINDVIVFAQDMKKFLAKKSRMNHEAALCCLGLLVEAISQLQKYSEDLYSLLVKKFVTNNKIVALLKMAPDRNTVFHDANKMEFEELKTLYLSILDDLISTLKDILSSELAQSITTHPAMSEEKRKALEEMMAKMLAEAAEKEKLVEKQQKGKEKVITTIEISEKYPMPKSESEKDETGLDKKNISQKKVEASQLQFFSAKPSEKALTEPKKSIVKILENTEKIQSSVIIVDKTTEKEEESTGIKRKSDETQPGTTQKPSEKENKEDVPTKKARIENEENPQRLTKK